MEALIRTPVPMVPGWSACSDAGANTTPVAALLSWSKPRMKSIQRRPSSDARHRKPATVAGSPNEHPSRVPPATPAGPQPRFLDASRSAVPPAEALWTCGQGLARFPASPEGTVPVRSAVALSSAWSWRSGSSGCLLVWLSVSATLRAEWPGAGAAVAETGSGGGPRPPARADRRRRAALIQ